MRNEFIWGGKTRPIIFLSLFLHIDKFLDVASKHTAPPEQLSRKISITRRQELNKTEKTDRRKKYKLAQQNRTTFLKQKSGRDTLWEK